MMKSIQIKVYSSLAIMFLLFASAFLSNDVIQENLFIALSIFVGLYAARQICNSNFKTNK